MRVNECPSVIKAEDAYDTLLRSKRPFGPGTRGRLVLSEAKGPATWTACFEVHDKAVWRRGRVLFRCGCEIASLPVCTCRTRALAPVAGGVGGLATKASRGRTREARLARCLVQ